jgi:hypothetical protein
VTPDAALAADGQARAAARLRGAAEALSVLEHRGPADQHAACLFAMSLLGAQAAQADWPRAGLPAAPSPGEPAGVRIPVGDRAVVLLAHVAMVLHTAAMPSAERPWHWDRLARFFAARLPASDPDLLRLRVRLLGARVEAGDTSREVFSELMAAVEFHRAGHGADAYLTSVAQANLSRAFRQRPTLVLSREPGTG